MKKIIILVSVALGLVFSSCSKNLDIAPLNSITDEQINDLMLNGSEETKAKILGQIASGLQQYFNLYNIPNVGTGALAPTTYCMQGIEWARGLQGNDIAIGRNAETNSLAGKAFYENTFGFSNSNESTNKAHWYANGQIINKANFVLGYMTEDMAKANPDYAVARASALMVRGYGYMCMMEEYTQPYLKLADVNAAKSGLPIYREFNPGQAAVAPSTAKETWDFVKADLKEAVTLLTGAGAGYTVGWANSEDLDLGLAKFLYARACLLTGDWAEVISACDDVIKSGKYSFIKEANWGGHNSGADMTAANLEVLPENNAFTAINVNPETILGYNTKSSYNPYVESALCAHFTRLANPFGTYASSTCARIDNRLYDKIAADDFRKDGWYPAEIKDWKYLGNTPAIVASYSAFKFACTYGLNDAGTGHTSADLVGVNDFTKFRYSEVVLMKAEAEAQSGNDNAAKTTLNTLLAARTRAGKPALTCANYPGMSGLSALQMVQLQYRIEMWGENGREYYNNKRWGIDVDRTGSKVHIASNVKISASEMTCDIIEEEKQNNSYWE
ncbi:MAG: RagB/SusD family nutrient uptake outer membrane protein [Bacteroidales bacterium]|nr:RagB/SusD family nutrient uptake outer membrane protein [Bacteroidales bacterium]